MTSVPASLDARNQIPLRLERIGMSQRFFATLCGITQTEFVRLMNGSKPLTGSQTQAFYEALDALEELVRMLEPLSPRWEDPKMVQDFLRSPRFPNLFALLETVPATPPQNVNEAWAGFIRDKVDECVRLETLIEEQAKAHEEWMRYFFEMNPPALLQLP